MSRAALPVISDQVDVAGLHKELAASIQGEVRFDRLSRALYSTDASVYQVVPLGVVVPKTEDDVLATLQACTKHRVPITARGGGTSQAGQAIGPGVQIDFSKYLHRILEINHAEKWVRAQPGCVLDDLNLEVKPFGLHFAVDISTSNRATIGGMIANNSSGTRSVIYGKTIDHVLELNVLLADGNVVHLQPLDEPALEAKCRHQNLEGACYRVVRRLASDHADEIERRYPKILRRVGGYNLDRYSVPGTQNFNLSHLVVGSEGTLGLVLGAKLRLVELPKARTVLVIQFAEVLAALAATPAIMAHSPSAVEVIDRYVLDSTKINPEASRLRDFLDGDPGAILIVELSGESAGELPPRLDALEAELRRQGHGSRFHRAEDAPGQGRIWKLRKAALGLSMAEKGDAKAISFVEDTAVAPDRLRDYIAEFLDLIRRHGTTAGVYAHASVGCLHVRPVINLKTVEGVQRFEALANEVADLVLKYGGALSGEHGDGLVRSPFQEKMFGPALYKAFREIKRTFDPHNLFNPGKIVDAAPLTASLRYGPAYVTPDVPTMFDFSADGGIVRAAELCAGVGECRKNRDGSMCPSFQATREEQHSTRGRANALRLALTGQLGFNGLTDPALKEVLDLCLECKACKSECPTNVDMARLKAEFLHQYYKKHGLPWRNWVFGNVDRLTRNGSIFAPISSWLMRSWPGRWLTELMLGIDRRRIPPPFALRDLWTLLCEKGWDYGPTDGRPVRLFLDTFVKRFQPQLAEKTIAVLVQIGCHVRCSQEGGDESTYHCCGRPNISNGLLDNAVLHAGETVERLYRFVTRGEVIIACEPSCILTIKDDYPALLREDMRKKAEVVAAACQTFEELVESLLSGGRKPPENGALRGLTPPAQALTFHPGPKKILVHGHCHQRSLVGMGPTLRLLRRIPGAEVIDLDAGCCGMAGSFGYEKEHYEISRLIGEQRLFPALRQADKDTVVVAPGFSCRMQIEHFTGIKAIHPAELLHSLMEMRETASDAPSANKKPVDQRTKM